MPKNPLKKYVAKRKFRETPEPKGKTHQRTQGKLQFVIQKHAATRLHYDLRLEVGGVLKSWAIPKGPSLDPSIKRLAIMVEDHPYAYRKFEGIIPSGYGAGSVMIWDQGTYDVDGRSGQESEKLIEEGLQKGAIHFTLNGDKLHGRFSLIKLKKQQAKEEWILIKSKDEFSTSFDIARQDRSVVSDKSMEEIAGIDKGSASRKGKKAKKPGFIPPMLTTLIDEPFDDPDWIFEIKWDGFRAIAELNGSTCKIYSRNQQLFNARFPLVARELEKMNLDAVIDGEIVVLDKQGRSNFQMLQNANSQDAYFYVFDILYLNGRDLRTLPLLERKAILQSALKDSPHIRYLEHVENQGIKFFNLCKKQKLEGIIGKQKQSHYQAGERSQAWVKIKAEERTEVVICGFTQPRKSRKNFGALVIGVYKKGILHFAGHVGGGFTEKKLEEIKQLLTPVITSKCPFKTPPKTNTPVTWVKPRFLCEVKFKEWTGTGILRMPIFLGMRADKPARKVTKEKVAPTKKIVRSQKSIQSLDEYEFITHQDKLYWEKEGITKGDLLSYYHSISSYILPYLKDRPESLRRYPNGIAGECFFQKNMVTYPDWLETVKIEHHHKTVNYMMIQDQKSLLYAVNLGSIEIHPWFSRIQSIENPDFMVFDLDPVDIEFDAVIETALVLHSVLTELKIPSYCKTSGGRGLHIGIPLNAQYSYEQVKHFALLVATLVHEQIPHITSLERMPKKRQNKVYIDCYQNNYSATLAAPYSVRARPGALVSTPLDWSEIKKGLDPANYHLFNTLKRLKQKGDLIKPLLKKGISLENALKRLQKYL